MSRDWPGHANQSVADGYSKLNEEVEFQKECPEKVRLSFEIPPSTIEVAPIVRKSEGLARFEQALVKQVMIAGCGGLQCTERSHRAVPDRIVSTGFVAPSRKPCPLVPEICARTLC
jgi:hypothetical protein